MWEVVDVSANTDQRCIDPLRGVERAGVMLHTTDGVNSLDWLQGGSARAGRPAGADALVDRRGKIFKLTPRGYFAFHAGVCRWRNVVDNDNTVSRLYIGIEIENADRGGQMPTDAQHLAVAGMVLVYAKAHNFSPLSVIGHYGYAHPMGRRSDPRGWDWGYMFWLMAHAPERCQLYGHDLIRGR